LPVSRLPLPPISQPSGDAGAPLAASTAAPANAAVIANRRPPEKLCPLFFVAIVFPSIFVAWVFGTVASAGVTAGIDLDIDIV
jgi:hypothetical protein